MKRLLGENSSELMSKNFQRWMRERGIVHETFPVYSPESNGKAERIQKTIINTTRCLLDMVKDLPKHTEVWDEAVATANYLRNRMYSASGNKPDRTPHEEFKGKRRTFLDCECSDLRFTCMFPRQRAKGSSQIVVSLEQWSGTDLETATAF